LKTTLIVLKCGLLPATGDDVAAHTAATVDSDPVVPLAWAEHTEALLKSSGVATSLQIYPGLWHSRCEEENRDVVAVLRDMLAE